MKVREFVQRTVTITTIGIVWPEARHSRQRRYPRHAATTPHTQPKRSEDG
jgi:hypothetical protein